MLSFAKTRIKVSVNGRHGLHCLELQFFLSQRTLQQNHCLHLSRRVIQDGIRAYPVYPIPGLV